MLTPILRPERAGRFVLLACLGILVLPAVTSPAIAEGAGHRKGGSGLASVQPPVQARDASAGSSLLPSGPLPPGAVVGAVPAQEWEDLLLLEAIRYLRLTPRQLQQMLPLCKSVEDRRAVLLEQTTGTREKLRRIARKQRDLLAKERGVSLQEQADALMLWQSLARKQMQSDEEILSRLANRLAQVLTRERVQRAYLLALGEAPPPEKEPRRVALLAPGSGFVLDDVSREEVRLSAIQKALSQRYPAALVASLVQQMRGPNGTRVVSVVQVNGESRPLSYLMNPEFPQAQNLAVMQEMDALAGRWNELSRLLIEGATDQELTLAVRPLAWRVFLSPNFKPLLTERLRGAAEPGEPIPEAEPRK